MFLACVRDALAVGSVRGRHVPIRGLRRVRADHTVNHTARIHYVPLEVIETTEDAASGCMRFAYS